MSHDPRPKIYLVAAVAANGVIGRNGQLPWRLPEDLKHFKEVTLGHPVIMGRRTWESLGKYRPLPDRENIVVTRNAAYDAPGARMADSLESALASCAGQARVSVIGGQQLFAEALRVADGLDLTEIHRDYEGDTCFPPFDRTKWRATKREAHTAKDGMRFDFVLYEPCR